MSSIDLAPTVLEAAGLQALPTFDGKSFLTLLNSPSDSIRDFVFAEHNWHDFEDCGRAVRSREFKYIRNFYPDVPGTPPADAVRSPTFQAMRKLRDAGQLTAAERNPFLAPRPAEELYDIVNDPHELTNLAADPRFAETLKRYREVLDKWQQETNDIVPKERRPDEFDRETGERQRPRQQRPQGSRSR